jgi:zona occludens toxin (predicted ATPase)
MKRIATLTVKTTDTKKRIKFFKHEKLILLILQIRLLTISCSFEEPSATVE